MEYCGSLHPSLALITSLLIACAPGSSGSTTGASGSGTGGGPSDGEGGAAAASSGSTAQVGSTIVSASVAATATTSTGAGGSTSTTGDGGSTSTGEGGAFGDGSGGQGGSGGGGVGGVGGAGGAGGSGEGGGGGAPPECFDAAGCPPTGSECVGRTCIDGTCGTVDIDGGTVVLGQIVGDCLRTVCDGAGATRDDEDDADLPDDDNACTNDVCDAGIADNPPLDAGESCGGNLVCDGDGTCVGCLQPSDCPGLETECITRSCSPTGSCGVAYADAATVLQLGQTAGNCRTLQCDGEGGVIDVPDGGDPPADLQDCVIETCDTGTPAETEAGAGTPCDDDGGALCDGAGSCVECLDADDCGTSSTCATYACLAGVCDVGFAGAGTLVADPLAGDCRRDECDGAGNVTEAAVYAADIPVDAVECTADVCTGGTPSNPPVTLNTPCTEGGGLRCDSAGACVECTAAAQCPSNVCVQGGCRPAQCDDGVRNGQETGADCGGTICAPCANGVGCAVDDDCTSIFCNPSTALCATPTCGDGLRNGAESDVDCGGGTCPDCQAGGGCEVDGDCTTNYCPSGICVAAVCGDGNVAPGEVCDDGDGIDGNGCDNDCRPSCGNGTRNTGEACDDGDYDSGDGCSATCAIEPYYQCTLASPSGCSRQEGRCKNGVDDDGDGQIDAADPDCPWNAQIPACGAGQTTYVFNSVRVPQAITSLATFTNEVTVPAIGTVRRAMMRINISHTWDEDLDISLRSATAVVLDASSDNGGSGDNYLNTRFRQAAATAITAGAAPFNSEYRPEASFDGFNAALAAGIWRLTVTDDAAGDIGTLQTFSLAICAE